MPLSPPVLVLHVDDDPGNRESLGLILRLEGFTVAEAATGREALQRAAEQPDVVLLDVRLPDLSGFEVCRQIKTNPTTAGIPVIQLSGYHTSLADRVEALEGGADVYLTKPVDPRELLAHIRSLVRARRAERNLQASEARLRLALEAAAMSTWEWDLATGRLEWSRGVEKLFGLPPGRFSETPEAFLDRAHPADRDALEAAVQTARDERKPFIHEFRVLWPDGSTHWVAGRGGFTFDAGGRPVRMDGVFMDVSERKKLEEQLRQSQKMEAVGHLAGGVAHDFNNLLTVISGYSELLLGGLPMDDPSVKFVVEIRKAGERATRLTRQLLAFSRKQILHPIVLDLNAIVAELDKMLGRLIGEDIDLVTVLDPTLGRVRADAGHLEHALMNLVVNARDAMPTGGRLTLETHNTELDDGYTRTRVDVKPGRYALLAVSDNGVGMTAEVQARIFEPFFTTKEVGKGTGLGLPMVHGFVKQSGGHVEVYSEVGRGTTVKIYLPRLDATDPEARTDAGEFRIPPGTETVLVAEDESGVRNLARLILESNGYTVLTARDGPEALATAEQHAGPLHLLLTDVVMPQMSGRQLADQLLVRHPGIKILYVSGYTNEAVVRHGVLESGTMFLQKPFTPTALARKVREILDA